MISTTHDGQTHQSNANATPTSKATYSLWSITRGQRITYTLAILAMVATNFFVFGAPLLGKYAIDVAVAGNFESAAPVLGAWAQDLKPNANTTNQIVTYLWLSAGLALFITCIGGLFMYWRGRLAAFASEQLVRGLREELYAKLHDLRASFYDGSDTGDLVQRSSSDVETMRVFLASDVIEIGRACLLLLCVLPLLFWLDSRLAWLSLVLMPVLIVGAYLFFQRVQQIFQVTDEAEGAMTATLQENLTGIRVVRAFARQEFEVEKFGEKNQNFRNLNYRLIRLMALYWSISDLFAMSQIGIVLIAGAGFVVDGSLTVGTLFAFLTYESMVIWPVRQLGRVLTDSGKAVVSLGRINEVLSEPVEDTKTIPQSHRSNGQLSLNNLSFAYANNATVEQTNVLSNLTVDITSGETIGVVGPPGCGKSSLVRLLLRLYPYHSGSATLDGNEISELDRHWLRQQISVVLQDPFLYSRNIRDNLLVGRADATDEQIEQACQQACILDAIKSFPQGFNAMVGERGVTLSGGQRQRLALARALIKDPSVLILDDALSAVDAKTEASILAALRKRKGRQTTLIIAHRLSSVMHADRILVLAEGAMVQLGSHEQLITQPGPYQQLCELQGINTNLKTNPKKIESEQSGG